MTQLLMNYSCLYFSSPFCFLGFYFYFVRTFNFTYYFTLVPTFVFCLRLIKYIKWSQQIFCSSFCIYLLIGYSSAFSTLLRKAHIYGIPQVLSVALIFEGTSWLCIKSLIHTLIHTWFIPKFFENAILCLICYFC